MSDNKHENYEILNLIGYGLAKFDLEFVEQFGYQTKTEFYEEMIGRGVGETVGVIKNRQDLFDPFFDNDRKGCGRKGTLIFTANILLIRCSAVTTRKVTPTS